MSAKWSAIPGTARTCSRTAVESHPPRQDWDSSHPGHPLWQLTTRPPRVRSGSQLPVEAGVLICVRAGRTVAIRERAPVMGS